MYKTANGWTKEKMIEHVKREFKGKSVVNVECEFFINKDVCRYRGISGAKCAIGMFIPDAIYHEGMENSDVETVTFNYPQIVKHCPLNSLEGLRHFQMTHDESEESDCLQNILNWIETNVQGEE